jgi:dimethylsulfone monooxygenase
MFGLRTMDHDTRYAYAEEWIALVRKLKLWTLEEEFDWQFFNIDEGFHQRKPSQRPHPPIINAGNSGIAARFAAKKLIWLSSAFMRCPRRREGQAYGGAAHRPRGFFANSRYGRVAAFAVRPRRRRGGARTYYIHKKGDFAAVDIIIGEQGPKHPNTHLRRRCTSK